MKKNAQKLGQMLAGLAVLAVLVFGARVALAESKAAASPCNPLPLNGVCTAGCSASCDMEPYAGGTCGVVNGTNCCICQL